MKSTRKHGLQGQGRLTMREMRKNIPKSDSRIINANVEILKSDNAPDLFKDRSKDELFNQLRNSIETCESFVSLDPTNDYLRNKYFPELWIVLAKWLNSESDLDQYKKIFQQIENIIKNWFKELSEYTKKIAEKKQVGRMENLIRDINVSTESAQKTYETIIDIAKQYQIEIDNQNPG